MSRPVDTAERFSDLVRIYAPVAAVVFVLVVGALIAVGLRFRSNAEEYPEGGDDRPLLELGYAALVAVVAAVLVYVTFAAMDAERGTSAAASGPGPPPRGALRVGVVASQWAWRFEYPGGVVAQGDHRRRPTLTVPAGRAVAFRVTSTDVVHSFWVAARKVKVDAFPGRTTTLNLVWPRPGRWPEGGRCNQYCGLFHTTMNFDVRALPGPAFDRWLAGRRAAGAGG